MSDPLEQFKQVFFEESAEAIDAIEQNLLNVQDNEVDDETINAIFRSAHSLKGGSATFGMNALSEFTHVMETLLDKVRAGEMGLSQQIVDCLFSSLDILRNLVSHYQFDDPIEEAQMIEVRDALEQLYTGGAQEASVTVEPPQSESEGTGCHWQISFAPHSDILKTGNDPLRYIEEVGEHGDLTVTCDSQALPDFDALDPTKVYCKWSLDVSADTAIELDELQEVFLWIEDEADLAFKMVGAVSEPAEPVPEVSQSPAAETSPEAESKKETPKVNGKAESASKAPAKSNAKRTSQSIRVDLKKIDSLINLLGELVITQSMLSTFNDTDAEPDLARLGEGLAQLERHTRDLQEGVMQIRMLPIDFCFSRFPRMVRDLSKQLGKKIDVTIIGETTEVDKTVIEELTDPLVHLVRNSVDHGIEMPQDRMAAGKSETGNLTLKAFHQVGNIIIEISDDGGGLNTERIHQKAIDKEVVSANAKLTKQAIHELIFAPGFSTAEEVTDLSGRGVGMDVVRRNIHSLGGTIDVRSSEGEGTTFSIRLPLTLAILDGQLVNVGGETYIIPMLSIIESIQLKPDEVSRVGGRQVSFKWRGQFIPILDLSETFGCPPSGRSEDDYGLVVVVENDNQYCGILVDELSNHQQVVVKSLEANYAKVDELSGATILGDGQVALILDVGSLIARSRVN